MDALTHAVETYVSVDANPVTEMLKLSSLLSLLQTIFVGLLQMDTMLKQEKILHMHRSLQVWHLITVISDMCTQWRISLAVSMIFLTVLQMLCFFL